MAQYIKEVAQYYRLELYMQLGTMKETDGNYLKFYRHVKTIEDHIKAITEMRELLKNLYAVNGQVMIIFLKLKAN